MVIVLQEIQFQILNPSVLNLDWPSQQCFSGRRWRHYPGQLVILNNTNIYEYHQLLYISNITIVPYEVRLTEMILDSSCKLQVAKHDERRLENAHSRQLPVIQLRHINGPTRLQLFNIFLQLSACWDQGDFNKEWRKNTAFLSTQQLTQNLWVSKTLSDDSPNHLEMWRSSSA